MQVATRRRLREELGIEASLELVYKFSYRAQFGDLGSENELCTVYLGKTGQAFSANTHEIADARYVSREALQTELRTRPEEFTPWFKMEWERLCNEFADVISIKLVNENVTNFQGCGGASNGAQCVFELVGQIADQLNASLGGGDVCIVPAIG